MARRVSWTNNSSGHSGTYVYRDETLDPQALPAPVATVDPVAQGGTAEWVDNEELAAGDYDYAVQDFDGQGVGALSAAAVYTAPADLSAAQIGDEIAGGIYAGIDNIGGTDYHIISGKKESEATGLMWKVSRTDTSGTASYSDGLANTQAIQAYGISDHPAAEHCVNYAGGGHNDWHMPAMDQLRLIYSNLSGHPDFSDNVSSDFSTWSSTTPPDTRDAVNKRMSDGYENELIKDGTSYVATRPIRRVPV